MSVSTKFENFCNEIRISSSSASNIAYRYKRITGQLNKDFWASDSDTNHSLYVGSYGRDTDIHVSDIDMLMRLPYEYYKTYDEYEGNGQSALLQAVKSSLQKTYSTTRLKGDGQVVVLAFEDGIKFEILPCFSNVNSESFTYPDTNDGGSWKVTNPVEEIKAIRILDAACNNNLKRLCRMARAWKDNCSVPIGGLLIDTLAYDFLKSWPHSDKSFTYYDWMVRDFLAYLKNRSEEQDYWLAPGSGHRVYREGKFEYKALVSYNIAVEAVEDEAAERSYTATTKWREIFGSKFKG
jgi:hypothetical protein